MEVQSATHFLNSCFRIYETFYLKLGETSQNPAKIKSKCSEILEFWVTNPLSANPTKWSNTLKQYIGKFPTNCLSVSDQFVKLVLSGLRSKYTKIWKNKQANKQTNNSPILIRYFTKSIFPSAPTTFISFLSEWSDDLLPHLQLSLRYKINKIEIRFILCLAVHGQLWATVEEAASITRSYSLSLIFFFQPKVTLSLVTRLGQSRAKHLMGFYLSNFRFNALTHYRTKVDGLALEYCIGNLDGF